MFVTDPRKKFSFFLIFNFLLYQIVLAVSDGGLNNTSTNSSRFSINTNKNQTTQSQNEEHHRHKLKTDSSPAPVTDSEVGGLTSAHHLSVSNTTSPSTKSNDDNYLFDKISVTESNSHLNGRFNVTSGAIAAATCLSLAVIAYIGILLWRNVIQRNYETREILLNEDDIGDINDEDMRHFEAACIEIEA